MPQDADLLAAIDIGSNSFHLVIAREEHGEIRIIEKLGDKVQLAAGIGEDKKLSEEAIVRGLESLGRFSERLTQVPKSRTRIVATNALRVAKNRKAFIKRAEAITNKKIEVIAGREEARLIYLGVSHSLSDDGGKRLVVDIGGGSTEFIIGERFEPQFMESLHMGCVSYRTAFFKEGKIRRKAFEKAQIAARMELQSIRKDYLNEGWQLSVGSSGTIRNIERVLIARGWCDSGISIEGLEKLKSLILSYEHVNELDLEGLKPERKSVFPSGVAILLAIFHELNINHMTYSDGALREGVLYDTLGRLSHEDVRERTVQALMKRFSTDQKHAELCAQTAQMLFDQTQPLWQLPDHDRGLLGWGANVHEIGLSIAHGQFHKHGAYLVEQSDLPGFSRDEQRELGALVRLHRRKLNPVILEEFEPARMAHLKRLVILLRLAISLCSPRVLQQPVDISLKEYQGTLKLIFNDDWPENFPLSFLQLEAEIAQWKRFGIHCEIQGSPE